MLVDNHIKQGFHALLTVTCFFSPLASAEEILIEKPINIAMSDWCPFTGNCGIGEGYIPEVIGEIFSRKNIKVNFYLMPWSRGLQRTSDGEFTGLLNPSQHGEASHFYFSKEPTGSYAYCYYTKKEDSWVYKGATSLSTRQTALIKDAGMGEDHAYINDPKNQDYFYHISLTDDYMDRAFKMLDSGRIDTFVNDFNVTEFYLKQHPIWKGKIKKAGCIKMNNVWLGLTPKFSERDRVVLVGEIYDQGVVELRNDGTLAKILEKYGVSDWEKIEFKIE
ncbi:substrate-binding periplasmic protein [Neptuniibacter sp. QD34_54]|uniref:substrate-binding periplasmic protein n=1 Tax=Neptuniibacter sp. QD34_54 TaxID=3398208 RepID=UPI0039F64078